MPTRLQQGFRLGNFEVRPLQGRMIGPEGEEHVQPKAMEVLVCLATHPGDVIERDDILAQVWGGTEHDDALTRTVSDLRHHLGDHPDAPGYIQTIPKRGYRLIAEVELPGDGCGKSDEVSVETVPPARSFVEDLKRRRVVRVAIAYMVVAWLVIQVAETVLPALGLPDWTVTLVIVLAILGFPVAVSLAWALQVTKDGVQIDRAPSRNRYAVVIGLATLVIVSGAFLLWGIVNPPDSEPGVDGTQASSPTPLPLPPLRTNPAVAVLRFQNISDDPATQYFSDGLGENLLDFLSNFTEFRVAARTSSWSAGYLDLDIPEIAERLQVDHVLEGSVQRNLKHVRVWAQLVNAEGFHVWSQTYDRELTVENIFEIQDEIALSVVDNLQVALGRDSREYFGQRPTHSLEALDYFMQGREYLRGVHSPEQLDAAVLLFEKAISLDTEFASARANLCMTHLYYYEVNYSPLQFEAAERACNRALTYDSEQDDVYTALGSLYRRSGQLDKAGDFLRKALQLNPRSGDAVYALARTREDQGDLAGARALLQKAIDLQPGYWFAQNTMGTFLRRVGESAMAVEYFERVTELVPDRAIGYINLAATISHLGDFERAVALYEKSIEVEPTMVAHSNLGIVHYRLGKWALSAEAQQRAIDMAPDDYYNWGHLGDARRQAGDIEAAETAYLEAIELVDEALDVNPKKAALIVARAKYEASLGHQEGVAEQVERALALAPTSASVSSLAARTYMLLGDTDKTLELVQRAARLGESPYYIAADPDLAPLQDAEVFVALLPEEDPD